MYDKIIEAASQSLDNLVYNSRLSKMMNVDEDPDIINIRLAINSLALARDPNERIVELLKANNELVEKCRRLININAELVCTRIRPSPPISIINNGIKYPDVHIDDYKDGG